MLFIHDLKKIEGAAHKNADNDGTFKQAFTTNGAFTLPGTQTLIN